MFIIAHLAAGLIIGNLTGNYSFAILGALFLDLDHLYVYAKHKVLFNPKKFWKAVTSPEDPYGCQRNYVHSIFPWIAVTLVVILIESPAGYAFSLGYLSHLILDMIDGSDFYPLYPFTRYNFKGPIKYLSNSEIGLTFLLFAVFLITL